MTSNIEMPNIIQTIIENITKELFYPYKISLKNINFYNKSTKKYMKIIKYDKINNITY